MLYLIQVQDDNTKLLKIGYSDNWSHRRSQYLLANPLTKFIDIRGGGEILERLFHLRYNKCLYPDYGREWFVYNQEIIDGFRGYTELELLDWLWDNRLESLDKSYFRTEKKGVQYQIVEKLYSGRELDWRNEFDNLWDRKLCSNINSSESSKLICNFMDEFSRITVWAEKMKLYCDFLDQYGDTLKTTDIYGVPREFQNYVNLLGTKRVKALKYRQNECENEYKIVINQDIARSQILSNFLVSSRLLLRDIKQKLQEIYDSLGVKKTAKASDLEEYFELKDIRIKMEDGRQSKGYELLKIKY